MTDLNRDSHQKSRHGQTFEGGGCRERPSNTLPGKRARMHFLSPPSGSIGGRAHPGNTCTKDPQIRASSTGGLWVIPRGARAWTWGWFPSHTIRTLHAAPPGLRVVARSWPRSKGRRRGFGVGRAVQTGPGGTGPPTAETDLLLAMCSGRARRAHARCAQGPCCLEQLVLELSCCTGRGAVTAAARASRSSRNHQRWDLQVLEVETKQIPRPGPCTAAGRSIVTTRCVLVFFSEWGEMCCIALRVAGRA